METNLQHEDLLIKLRAKLNEEKIKLWEPPYFLPDNTISQSLQDLATKYAAELSIDQQTILNALHELQIHSLERSKANADFQETGFATFRVRATIPGEKPQVLTIKKKLNVEGSDLIAAVANEINIDESRLKLIFNGKLLKPAPSLEEQGLKNGIQIMALIMAETAEEAKQEDTMYMEMRQTRDDAMLLSETVDELADDEFMKLEDQSGNAIQLPAAEKRSLLVGLALHERGRAHIKKQEYALALVLLLEADRLFNECRSSILQSVDNYAVLQVDVSWCYLCLQALRGAADAARRLALAERALHATYGESGERVKALKGTDANERVLFMRLYLLQGIVAYHQNKRDEARRLLERAEVEINALRVDEDSVAALMELGWSGAAARAGLRAAGGEVPRAHHYLADRRDQRRRARAAHQDQSNRVAQPSGRRRMRFAARRGRSLWAPSRHTVAAMIRHGAYFARHHAFRTSFHDIFYREARRQGLCADGSPVNQQLIEALVGMGYDRRIAVSALRQADNRVAVAVRIIEDQPEMLSSDESDAVSSDDSVVEPDTTLVSELEAMGYTVEDSRAALARARNHISGAVDLLVACGGCMANAPEQSSPSTSSGTAKEKHKREAKEKRRREQQAALARLRSTIHNEEDDYLDSSLLEEEDFLVQYKSLL